MNYEEFILKKRTQVRPHGFKIKPDRLNDALFPWQKEITVWALHRGRSAIFAACGLGKTLIQLEWASWVYRKTKQPVIIHCPVGVRPQTEREAKKFGIKTPVKIVNSQAEVIDGINLVNYEKLHKFDPKTFAGVVLDESSILKGQDSKTRKAMLESYGQCNFRLACTATPAPNDHMELGFHAEFLGVCTATEMLNRFFVHDSGETQTWRLKKHAKKDFWRWVASWAVCLGMPSDIGGDDAGFDLPELVTHRHMVKVDRPKPKGTFFHLDPISAISIHEERRISNQARCEKAAELVRSNDDFWIVWCDTNYEADLLRELIPEAVEVRGAEKDEVKEAKLRSFSEGETRVIISKPSIAGFGMNWQHCNQMIFAGLSYSFEKYYQAVRRCYRFGQEREVHSHIILADTETAVQQAVARKEADFEAMRDGMSEAMREGMLESFGKDMKKTEYKKEGTIQLPNWLHEEIQA